MKKSWAMKWARDLETTSAKQSKDVLNNGKGGFCCLGRLCVVAGLKGRRDIHADAMVYGETEWQVLPNELRELVGMRTRTGELPHERMYGAIRAKTLAGLNDKGVSFREIAKIIRANWKSL